MNVALSAPDDRTLPRDREETRNAFHEPWFLEPALRYLAEEGAEVEVVAPEDGAGRRLGVLPVLPVAGTFGRAWSAWCHLHCFDSTPLVAAGSTEAFLDALFARLQARGAGVLRWVRLPRDTAFSERLLAFLAATGRGFDIVHEVERPLLWADRISAEDYLAAVLPAKRRREVARCRRKLEAMGTLETRVVEAGDELLRYGGLFLDLEASGWKGRAGTALKCRPDERAFFETVVANGVDGGKVFLHSLELDGRPIAMTSNFRSGPGVWAYKTTFDETLRNYSPGVVLEVGGSLLMIEDPSIAWIDAGTMDDNTVMARLWPDRRPVVDVLIEVRPGPAHELRAFGAVERAYRSVRGLAKRVYHSVRS